MKKDLIRLASILSALLLFFITADAQVSGSYNLSAYKLPDYRYRQLETDFKLSGSNNSFKVDDQKQLNRFMTGVVGASYNSYMNSRKNQRSQSFSASFKGNSSHKDNQLGLQDNSDFYSSINYRIYNKRYFANKLFVSTGVSAQYRYGHIKNLIDFSDSLNITQDFTTNEHDVTIDIPLGFGIGRIEQVQDFQKAIYIYEDLLKSGRAVAGKSEQEVMELATLISQLRNKRYFDFRIRKIQELETVDSFLIANNFKTQSDARYFATLVDNWNFVTHFIRESGTSIALEVTPQYFYNKDLSLNNLNDIEYKSMRESYGAQGGLVFMHYKPLNLYWQTNTTVNALAGYTVNTFEDSDTIVHSDYTNSRPSLNMHLTQSIEYYPNTRTRMIASLNAGYNKFFEEKDVDSKDIRIPAREWAYSRLSVSVDYYLSQRLRLDATASISYNLEKIEPFTSPESYGYLSKKTGFNSGFECRLAYSIF